MERAIVTGANGHIGANLCRALLARGTRVVALVRAGSDRRGLEGVDVELVEGDVLDAASVRAAMEGCDTLFHCAAVFAIWAKDERTILRPAIEGTENVLRAAKEAGIRRTVLTSSVAAVGASESADRLLDADAWAPAPRVPYYVAKQRAERRAWELAAELDLWMVSMLPTMVLGPHDHRVTPSSKVVLDMLRGSGATVDGGMNVVDVRDVAEAHVRAAERGQRGQRYIVGSDNLTNRELGLLVERISGRKVKHIGAPRWVLSGIAGCMELGAAITGRPPSLTRAAVRDLVGHYAWYDLSKTKAHLELTPRGAEDVVRATAEWFTRDVRMAA